ncbi:saccharopine dehydrogenase NADP-binding domain-containing protein [Nocardioides sp. ChNu-153]|uniref:saccharopine dehydrogenase family protein n=1 Tax=unclassified Nocardioides TaxID=2615069 RepID=UPI0024049D48|nr:MULTISPECIES: saccharopine dehydrogenase NADP-binding domain-containing protein [unclassified Nocardioides]MDF9717670.1 saccharopine dehydrogenase NADP-binding domain-containing protein [Nocardioides sp. ChNu-99]MDN7123217.1 saccharopine dehydrogenase NADP-binding domain-containing protein [Nocardioides sp. ChNu-153]
MPERADRELDLVVLGATGFTGRLTAAYLARHAPADLRWALAGRNEGRLAAVRDGLPEGSAAAPELVVADSSDAASLRAMAERTRLVLTTVGPFLRYGEPLVAACAAAGTDYVDSTGEPEFVDDVWLRHHAAAEASGARIVHACGFDSIPHDLGVRFAVRQLPDDVPIRARGVVRAAASSSSGTLNSALEQFARARTMSRTHAERRKAEGRPEGRRVRGSAGKPHRDPVLGYWLLPLPTIDPMVVVRSAAADPAYGPDFTYSHYAGTKTLRYAAGGAVGVSALAAAAQVGPLRRALQRKVGEGNGPDERRRERSWFTVDVVAEGGGRTVHARVSGGDPGYTETATMLAESALCLLLDDNPPTAGMVTTATAMGDHLTGRLQQAGIRFELL